MDIDRTDALVRLRARSLGGWLALVACAMAMPAWAGRLAKVEVTVTPAPAQVTFSQAGLASRAAYQVSILNRGLNPIKDVSFKATSLVQGASASAPYFEATGQACAKTAAPGLAIQCAVGVVAAGTTKSFVVVFDAPASGSSIKLSWLANFTEVPDGYNNASTLTALSGAALTTLSAPDPNAVRSYVPSSGGTLFTGLTGIPTTSDKWTTTVTVPSAAIAQVVEDTDPNSCSPDYKVCVRSTLTIPGTFAHLTIKLRRDASTLNPCADIRNAVLRYEPGAFDANGVFVAGGPPVDIPKCAALPGGMPNASHPRCVDSRIAYTKKNAPNASLVGDWEFVLKALENGRISW